MILYAIFGTSRQLVVAESLQAVIDALDREDEDPTGHVARLRSRLSDLRRELD